MSDPGSPDAPPWPAPHPVIDAPYGPRYTPPPPEPTPTVARFEPLPPPPPKSKKWQATFVAICLAVAVLGGIVAVQFVSHEGTPRQWDTRVAALATFVERTTGKTFVRPVQVRILGDTAFEALIKQDATALTDVEMKKIADNEALGRAFGWYNNTTKLFDDTNTLNTATILAYYSYDQREIVARSDQPEAATLDVALRVTIVHELTHALQDQRLDIRTIQDQSRTDQQREASTALVEGHAVWVENQYLASLSEAELKAYDAANAALGAEIDTQVGSANAFLSVPVAAPYVYGPVLADAAHHTPAGIDQLFVKPPVAMDQVLDPRRYFAGDQPELVTTPAIDNGQVTKLDTGVVGPVRLYLTLAAALTPVDAWKLADDWGNDEYQSYARADGTVCVNWNIVGDDAAATARLRTGLQKWAAGRVSGALARVESGDGGGALIRITACDPGATSTQPLLGQDVSKSFYVRANVLASLLGRSGKIDQATCATDKLFQQFALDSLAAAGDDVRSAAERLLAECA